MFPQEWCMTERIAVEFCHVTRWVWGRGGLVVFPKSITYLGRKDWACLLPGWSHSHRALKAISMYMYTNCMWLKASREWTTREVTLKLYVLLREQDSMEMDFQCTYVKISHIRKKWGKKGGSRLWCNCSELCSLKARDRGPEESSSRNSGSLLESLHLPRFDAAEFPACSVFWVFGGRVLLPKALNKCACVWSVFCKAVFLLKRAS